jgi:hypothetical protein
VLVRICRIVALVAGGLLACVGIVVLPTTGIIAIMAGGSCVGLFLGGVANAVTPDGGRRAHAAGRRGASIAVVAGLAVAGLVAMVGTALLSIVPVVLLAVAGWLWRRHATGGVDPANGPVSVDRATAPAADVVVVPQNASTRELCRAWCHSARQLGGLPPGPARWSVAETRRALLEELERRDPAGVDRWLRAGAAGDPGRYLTAGP